MLGELLFGSLLVAATSAVGLVAWSIYREVRRQEAMATADERRDEEWHRCMVRRCQLRCDLMQADLDRSARPLAATA